MAITGVSHVGLTVSDLAASQEWYAAVMDWEHVLDGTTADTTFAMGRLPDGTVLVLRQHQSPAADAFNERRPGLDHLSFTVSEASDLDAMIGKLETNGNRWSPIQKVEYGQLLNFRDPDNIAIELSFRQP